MPEAGYALVEMLLSTAIAAVLLGVLLQFVVGAQQAVQTQSDVTDLQQRLRVAVESIRRDLLAAGAGPSNGEGRGPLGRVFAPVVPARTGFAAADAELSYYADRISVMYVPAGAPQSRLVAMEGPAAPLTIDGNAPGCSGGTLCGFAPGDRVLILEPLDAGGPHEVFTVSAVDGSLASLFPTASLSRTYADGSLLARVIERVYYLDRPGKRLMVYDGERSDLPLVDHVADLRFEYYADPSPGAVPPPPDGAASCAYAPGPSPVSLLEDLGGTALKQIAAPRLTDGPVCGQPPYRFDADLLRVRRIRVTIRLETASAELRGFGPDFATRGTSTGANRYVPDAQITFDVVPRNMAVQ
jgi:type II secretory pathway pseudopilin PulG